MKKIFVMLCIFAFCFTSLTTVSAKDTRAGEAKTEKPIQTVSLVHKNPIYDEQSNEEVSLGSISSQKWYAQFTSDFMTDETGKSVIDLIRENMVGRKTALAFQCVSEDYLTISMINELFYYWLDEAMSETGKPREGDYLKLHYDRIGLGLTTCFTANGKIRYDFYMDFSYLTTAHQEQEVDEAVDKLLKSLDVESLSSDYEKAKVIYDYMCDNITYDYENLYDDSYELKFTAYAALVNKTAVCQGYSSLMYRLLRECGVGVRSITGYSYGTGHAWNIVKMEDSYYYYADSTWDAGQEEYSYFLKGSSDFEGHNNESEFQTADFKEKYPVSKENYLARPSVKLTTLASSGKPQLTWKAVEGADKYEVWRRTGGSGEYGKYYTTTGTVMTNESTTPGIIYYYKVRAVSGEHPSSFSDVKYIACDLAQPVTALTTIPASGKPQLTWAAVEGADKYEVWRRAGGSGEYAKYYTTTETVMTNESTTPGIIYYYKVKAICASNYGGNSADSAVKYIACDCAQPSATLETIASSGKPKLTWKAVEGASKYEIWRRAGSDDTFTKYYTTTATGFTNTSATPGIIYHYKVKAICGINSGGNSADSSMKYIACDCAMPVIEVTYNSGGKPVISWGKVDGASKYELWMSTGGSYNKIGSATGTAITHKSAESGQLYYYKVKAICGINSGGNSALSSSASKVSK